MTGSKIDKKLSNENLDILLSYTAEKHSNFLFPKIQQIMDSDYEYFCSLGNWIANWTKNYLGESFAEQLVAQYFYIIRDMSKGQLYYEKHEKYLNSSFEECNKYVYNNPEVVSDYFGSMILLKLFFEGEFVLCKYYTDTFLKNFVAKTSKGRLLELGSGAGVLSMLALDYLKNWQALGVDISETSVKQANEIAEVNKFNNRVKYVLGNALEFVGESEFDAVLSYMVLEHLEDPNLLFKNLARNLKTGGYGFVSTVLEGLIWDHIYEYRRESEVVLQAEKNGFRVISYVTHSQDDYPTYYKFLPRTMGLILQKRRKDTW